MPIADLMNMKLVSVLPKETVQLAIARMLEEGVGSVAVTDGGTLVGIFTERDVLRLAGEGTPFGEVRVGDVMTTELATIGPDDDVLAAARLMAERRIRHLPIVQGDLILGIAGIRDVMRVLLERAYERHDPEARDTARALLRRPASS